MSVVPTRCVTEPCWLRGTCSRSNRNKTIILRRIYVTDGPGHGRVVRYRSGDRAAARPAWIQRIGDGTQLAAVSLGAYDSVRKRATAALTRQVEQGISPDAVATTVLRAIKSRSPSLRYRVGADAVWLPRVKQVAPWSVFAAGVRKTFDV